MNEINEIDQLQILYSQFFRHNSAIQQELGMYRTYNQKEIKKLLKKRIIEDDEDFTFKEQKMISNLVQSKITILSQDEISENTLGHKFVGDFLDIWVNLDQLEETGLGGDFFPMLQKPVGIIQISKSFETLLRLECLENDTRLEKIKERF